MQSAAIKGETKAPANQKSPTKRSKSTSPKAKPVQPPKPNKLTSLAEKRTQKKTSKAAAQQTKKKTQ